MAVRKTTNILKRDKFSKGCWLVGVAPHFPTMRSSRSEARGRTLYQMSSVKSVLLELKMEVSVEMTAAIIAAIMRPRRPATVTSLYLNRLLAFVV